MLNDGYQVLKDRRIDRECPGWVANRFEFLNFLSEKFPKWLDETSPKHKRQREEAALYFGVAYYYFRMGLPDSHVALLLSVPKFRVLPDGSEEFIEQRIISVEKVKRIVLAIRRRHEGLRADGSKLTGQRGRPRGVIQPVTAAGAINLTKVVQVLETEGVI
jgi:hypothetical protein